ncbi:MAG: DUF2493 domain-containing protein [Planctomycetes bacterium]|nr:DUF2493 domain-containing protein [Planctomycetota bacterium]
MLTLRGMTFRVLIIGGRQRFEYARLRDAIDALLAKRLPDVEILTAGGPGVPALAACYARSRGLPPSPFPLTTKSIRATPSSNATPASSTWLTQWCWWAILPRCVNCSHALAAKGVRVVAFGATPVRSESGEPGVDDDGPGMVRGLPD